MVLPALAGLGSPWWQPGARGVIAGLHGGVRPGACGACGARGNRLAGRRHRRGDGGGGAGRDAAGRRRADQRRDAAADPGRRRWASRWRSAAPTRPCSGRRCSRRRRRAVRERRAGRRPAGARADRRAPRSARARAAGAHARALAASSSRAAGRSAGRYASRPRSRPAASAPSTSSVCPRPARLERQLDARLADVQGHGFAHVLDADDVGARGRDQAKQLREAAGSVGHAGEDPHAPPLLGFVAQQQRGEQPAVDVAARDDRDRGALDRAERAAHQRRHGDRAGALGDELRVLGEEHHRVGDLLLADGQQLVEQLAAAAAG